MKRQKKKQSFEVKPDKENTRIIIFLKLTFLSGWIILIEKDPKLPPFQPSFLEDFYLRHRSWTKQGQVVRAGFLGYICNGKRRDEGRF